MAGENRQLTGIHAFDEALREMGYAVEPPGGPKSAPPFCRIRMIFGKTVACADDAAIATRKTYLLDLFTPHTMRADKAMRKVLKIYQEGGCEAAPSPVRIEEPECTHTRIMVHIEEE